MQKRTSIRLGDFWFEPATGELKKESALQGERTPRLAPQPAQLLMLLIDGHPEIITREKIQQALWPGVTSDFDSNLHFCVRQIRSALGESASSPEYIETIPRRGYRLIADVGLAQIQQSTEGIASVPIETQTEFDATEDQPDPTNTLENQVGIRTVDLSAENRFNSSLPLIDDNVQSSTARKFRFSILIAGALLGLLVFISVFILVYVPSFNAAEQKVAVTSNQSSPKVRIAIMPFKSEREEFGVLGNGEIAMNLLDQFSADFETLDVIGPSTTEPIVTANPSLSNLADKTNSDLIVNGRYTSNEGQHRLLVEIIRANDGSHVWVKYFDAETSNAEISRLTLTAIRAQISAFVPTVRNANADLK